MSQDLIKNQCILKHEQYREYIGYRGNLASVSVDKDSITVNVNQIENTFNDFVITSIKIMGYYHDADGVLNEVSEWKSGLWIEPKSIADPYVVIPLPNENKENISEADFCSRKGVKKNCHGWGIEGFRGLEIKID